MKISKALLVTAAAGVLAGFLLGGAFKFAGLWSEIAASWVQAVGAIIALGVSVGIANSEAVRAKRSDFARIETEVGRDLQFTKLLTNMIDDVATAVAAVSERVAHLANDPGHQQLGAAITAMQEVFIRTVASLVFVVDAAKMTPEIAVMAAPLHQLLQEDLSNWHHESPYRLQNSATRWLLELATMRSTIENARLNAHNRLIQARK